jgi:Flp pilus assembly protein TadD
MLLAPNRIGGALNLAVLYLAQGNFEEAVPLLRHVLASGDRPDAQAASRQLS